MKTILAALWLMVFVVLAYDVYFAIAYRDSINEWESNSFALAIINQFGLCAAIFFRVITVIIAIFLVYRAPRRTKWVGSLAAFLIHAYLLGVYIAIWCFE